jgi:hypothetical protein
LSINTAAVRSVSKEAGDEELIRVYVDQDDPHRPPSIKRRYGNAQDLLMDILGQASGQFDLASFHRLAFETLGVTSKPQQDEASVMDALAFGNIGNVFLKQFRDCADPTRACYQAVCKTDTLPGRFHGGGSLDESRYRITIQNLESEPLVNYLGGGKSQGNERTIEPRFAFFADLDFELTNGRVIANPYAVEYVPDVSPTATLRYTQGLRMVRRSRQRELLPEG